VRLETPCLFAPQSLLPHHYPAQLWRVCCSVTMRTELKDLTKVAKQRSFAFGSSTQLVLSQDPPPTVSAGMEDKVRAISPVLFIS
jgi:hypothetical protein